MDFLHRPSDSEEDPLHGAANNLAEALLDLVLEDVDEQCHNLPDLVPDDLAPIPDEVRQRPPVHREEDGADREAASEQFELPECVVCSEAPRSVVLLPCRHLLLCQGCMTVLQQHSRRVGGTK